MSDLSSTDRASVPDDSMCGGSRTERKEESMRKNITRAGLLATGFGAAALVTTGLALPASADDTISSTDETVTTTSAMTSLDAFQTWVHDAIDAGGNTAALDTTLVEGPLVSDVGNGAILSGNDTPIGSDNSVDAPIGSGNSTDIDAPVGSGNDVASGNEVSGNDVGSGNDTASGNETASGNDTSVADDASIGDVGAEVGDVTNDVSGEVGDVTSDVSGEVGDVVGDVSSDVDDLVGDVSGDVDGLVGGLLD
tara:strand:- start:540 stop:1295 length:756 start_codon:yes stop_codon:yes gene_type:complete